MKRKAKVLVAALLVCVIVQAAAPMGVLASGAPLSLVDVVQVARTLSGVNQLTPAQQLQYDLNGDGTVNILDLTRMVEMLLAQSVQNTQSQGQAVQSRICDTCHQYPCVCSSTVAAPAAQPTICGTCSHYPCICSTAVSAPAAQPTICGSCSHYPCVCGTTSTGSTAGTSTWRCGNCHSNPCVCSSYSSGHHSSSGSHHGSSHH